MSNEIVAQNMETPASPRGRAFQIASLSLIVVLMGLVGWLLYDLHQLKQKVKAMEVNVKTMEVNIGAIESELSVVGALARNANSYAHSHYSDARMKRNITDLDNALANTLQLRAVTFNWNTDEFPDMGSSNQTQIGLIAQEVEKVYPELVSVDPGGYRMIDYAGLTPILLEAIKEQQTTINGLQQKDAEFMKRITKLEDALGVGK